MENGLCKGCLRTIEEIAQWSTMTDEQKEFVLENIAFDRAFGPMEDH